MSMQEDVELEPLETLVESLLKSVTEINNSSHDIKIEQKIFTDFGKNLQRTLPIILELQTHHDTIPNARKLLDLLLNKFDFGKDLVYRCKIEGNHIKESEIKSIIGLLEGVTRNIGEDLSSIPTSVFSDVHIRRSIQSLSTEMTNTTFSMSKVQVSPILNVHEVEELNPKEPILEDNNEENREMNHQSNPASEESTLEDNNEENHEMNHQSKPTSEEPTSEDNNKENPEMNHQSKPTSEEPTSEDNNKENREMNHQSKPTSEEPTSEDNNKENREMDHQSKPTSEEPTLEDNNKENREMNHQSKPTSEEPTLEDDNKENRETNHQNKPTSEDPTLEDNNKENREMNHQSKPTSEKPTLEDNNKENHEMNHQRKLTSEKPTLEENNKENHEMNRQSKPTSEEPILEDNKENHEMNHQSIPTSEEMWKPQNSKCRQNDHLPRLSFFMKGNHYNDNGDITKSFKTLIHGSEHMEPLYDTFFCPLTRKIMDDPVILRNGITFERRTITEWLQKFKDSSEDLICPVTGKKLETIAMSSNLALKSAIEEWKRRNDLTKMKVAHSLLLEARSKSSILEALGELKVMCKQKQGAMEQLHSSGFIPLLTYFVKHNDLQVRYEAVQTLTYLAEDKKGKEKIANMDLIASAVRMLSSHETSEQYVSVSFLLELSKSKKLCEKIGSVTRAIWMLITLKCNKTIEESISDKAGRTLRNLERCPKNIKCMVEHGFLDPLINNLVSGPKEMQIEMARLIGELPSGHGINQQVTQQISPTILKMTLSKNAQVQEIGYKALVQLSLHHPNRKALVEAGVPQFLMDEIFEFTEADVIRIDQSKKYSTIILANILESASDPEILEVELDGQKIDSDYSTKKLVEMMKQAMPNKINLNITRILISLMKFQKAAAGIVKAVEETNGIDILVEFLNHSDEELRIVATKLLIKLSHYMGYKIAETMFKIRGQVDSLLHNLDTDIITETQVVSAKLLATLPRKNLMLNQALLDKEMVQMVLETINKFQRGEMRKNKDTMTYLEGLVGILVRFTTTLHDRAILSEARNYDLASVFAQLVSRMIESDEIQWLAAIGLENLSSESIYLSKQKSGTTGPGKKGLFKCCTSYSEEVIKLPSCPVHRGGCSSSTTFCLIESRAVEKLIVCLEHQKDEVVDATLSAICTLLDDRLDVNNSLKLLHEKNILQYLLKIFREQRKEEVWHKSLWLIEKFLTRGNAPSVDEICKDEVLPSALVAAIRDMNNSTRKLAENVSRYLFRRPNCSR